MELPCPFGSFLSFFASTHSGYPKMSPSYLSGTCPFMLIATILDLAETMNPI
jgi:hypothetical protein